MNRALPSLHEGSLEITLRFSSFKQVLSLALKYEKSILWMIYSILELSKINALLHQAEKDVTVVAMDDILYSRTVQD